MTEYRRALVHGGLYFFTVALTNRRESLLTDHISSLRSAFQVVRARYPFVVEAAVILPDHLHMLWQLPPGDAAYALRWRLIKKCFSRSLPGGEPRTASRIAKGERGIWQRRYWEHVIRDERDLARHLDYIHFNPVKHGHAPRAADWPHSSIHRHIRLGLLPEDWGGADASGDGGFGEARDGPL
ncbi:MAG: transposase [Burkholderiales bacterium]|nr:transposase [Burkholderiales bacterium]